MTLNLIDIGMVGGLLYMVCYSGWETYIEKLRKDQDEQQPGWLGRGSLGPIGQKFKLMAAMATISGIKLLEMSQKMTKENIVVADALIRVHLAYVVTALVFYYMSKHENDEHRKGSEGASKVDA